MKKEVLIKILSGIDDDFVFEIVPEICDSCSGEKKTEKTDCSKRRLTEIVLPYVALTAAFIVVFIVFRGIRSEFKTENSKIGSKKYDLTVKAYVPKVENDDPDSVNFDSEIDIWNSKNINGFEKPDGQAEYIVEFLGKEYTGRYIRTFCSYWQYENYLRKEYKTSDGTFAIKAKDGKAQITRITSTDVRNYINYNICPKIDKMTVIAKAMGVNIDYFAGYGSVNRQSNNQVLESRYRKRKSSVSVSLT